MSSHVPTCMRLVMVGYVVAAREVVLERGEHIVLQGRR